MGDDDAFHAKLLRRCHHGQDFRGPNVTGGEHHVVLGDDLQTLARCLGDLAVFGHVQERAGDAQGAHLAGDAHPVRQLAFVALTGHVFQFVGVVN